MGAGEAGIVIRFPAPADEVMSEDGRPVCVCRLQDVNSVCFDVVCQHRSHLFDVDERHISRLEVSALLWLSSGL